MKLKRFHQFLLEFKDITTYRSSSGRTKHVSRIFDRPADAKSHSASVLLKNQLMWQEMQSLIDSFDGDIQRELKRFIKWGGNSMGAVLNYATTLNNQKFLQDKLKEKGKLDCEYCGKKDLKLYSFPISLSTTKKYNQGRMIARFNKRDGATCDHKQPKSKGGDLFDYNNLAVCCYRCNNRKKDMSWEEWQKVSK